MRPHFSDSETRTILEDRKRQRDAEWLKKQIGTPTYLRSLLILGYPLDEAQVELRALEAKQNENGR